MNKNMDNIIDAINYWLKQCRDIDQFMLCADVGDSTYKVLAEDLAHAMTKLASLGGHYDQLSVE